MIRTPLDPETRKPYRPSSKNPHLEVHAYL